MSPDVTDTVASEVRAELARQRLTQQDLADRIGEGQWWVSRRLTGTVPFAVAELVRVAEALGVPVERFIHGEVAA